MINLNRYNDGRPVCKYVCFYNDSGGSDVKNVFKFILTAFIIYFITAGGIPARAEGPETRRSKVVMYYFNDLSESPDYRYYSYIIPNAIIKEVNDLKKYDIQTFQSASEYVDESAPAEDLKKHITLLTEWGVKYSADYIITGSYSVADKKINIKSQIFSVREKRISRIVESSEEIGVLLQDLIDRISRNIRTEIDKYEAVYAEKEKERDAPSPFIPLYRAVSGITLGINYGTPDILGDWGKIYKNRESIFSAFIQYDMSSLSGLQGVAIIGDSSLSLNYDYLITTPGYTNDTRSYMKIWGMTMNYAYNYRFINAFYLSLSAGFGMAFSRVVIPSENDGPMNTPIAEKESRDPFLNLSVYANYLFSPLLINAGIAYKRIFYTDKAMEMVVYFFGFGFRI
jgi:TolB-like protein